VSIHCCRKHFHTPKTHSSPYVRSVLNIVIQVVASQDWPEVTKYVGLVCAQPPREEIIKDLFKCWNDPHRGIVYGGMIR